MCRWWWSFCLYACRWPHEPNETPPPDVAPLSAAPPMHIRLAASSPTSPPNPPPRRAPAPRRNTITRKPADPRPSETLDPRVYALPASRTPEFESNRPIKTNRLTGGSSNPAESTGSGRARLGISGFQVYVSGAGWARWLGLDPRWGGGGERISAIRGKRDRVWGSRAAGSETASEFGSRDGERHRLRR